VGEDGHCCDQVCCWMSLLVCGVFILADCVRTFQLGGVFFLMLCKEFECDSYSLLVFVKLFSFVF
jgi:hypothetical protein